MRYLALAISILGIKPRSPRHTSATCASGAAALSSSRDAFLHRPESSPGISNETNITVGDEDDIEPGELGVAVLRFLVPV